MLTNIKIIKKLRGLAAIEFTLVMLGFFAPLLLGSVEIGRVLYNYNVVVNSVREAARYMSVQSSTATNYTTKVTAAKCLVVYGNEGCTGSALVPGLTVNKVNIVNSNISSSVSFKVVTVEVTDYSLGYVTTFFGSTKDFNNISASMRQKT